MGPDATAISNAIDAAPYLLTLGIFVLGIVRSIAIYMVDKRVKDQQLRTMLENAINNGLGTIQQAASGAVNNSSNRLLVNIPLHLAPGVKFVLDHAPEALKRWNISPEMIAEKLIALAGRREIETNIATTASSSTSAIVPPLTATNPVTAPAPETRRLLVTKADNGVLMDAPAIITPAS